VVFHRRSVENALFVNSVIDTADVHARLDAAWSAFLSEYAEFGGHRYHGWDHKEDPRNYYGPRYWSEADCAFRFGSHLERVFPGQVHFEMPIADWTFADYRPDVDKRQRVDVVVSDLEDFIENETSQDRFRTHQHSLFVEAKYFPPDAQGRGATTI
jgi:hypothetical protein